MGVSITQPADGGTFKASTPDGMELNNGTNSIDDGTELTLVATPKPGWRFDKFTADGVEVSSPYTVNGRVTLSAEFEQIVHTVTIAQPADGGTFKVTTPSGTELNNSANTVAELTMLTLTPAPTSGYRLVKLTADGVEVSSPYTVTGNVTLSAEFELIPTPPTPTPPTPGPAPGPAPTPDPVANEVIATDAVKVWATKGNLNISTVTDQTVQVYNLAGLLVKQADISSGDTCWQLPSGIYIVRIDNQRYKVIL